MAEPWTEYELRDLHLPWEQFHSSHPHRTYDSYEVKRRRVTGGSAGKGRPRIEHRYSVACPCDPLLIHRHDDERFVILDGLG